jgi:TRAP-type mannitol/chloroaromatic compound transport system permease large subunit
MTAFIVQNMAPIMFLALVVFLLIGYPVAFSLAFVGLGFGTLGIWLGLFHPTFLQALPDRVFGVMSNDTLLAIPFFTFMGLILERSGMAEDLLDSAGKLFGPVRGGVAYAVIFVGALLAATTGVVAASVIAMGLISLPIMLRYGYDRRLASGVIAASGTLAQIIPPSLVLIVMADQLGRSVGDMYKGAIVPGLILTGLYMTYVFIMTLLFPKSGPALPTEARSFGEGAAYGPVIRATTFPLALIVWGMIVLFDTPAGVNLLRAFLPWLEQPLIHELLPWLEAQSGIPLSGDAGHILVVLCTLTALYLVYVGLIRFAPRAIAVLAAGLAAAIALLLVWFIIGDLAAGFAALPPASAGVLSLIGATIAWIAAEWADALAIVAMLGAAASLLIAPSRPVAHAVLKIISDLLPPLILIFLVLGTIFQGIATPTEGGAMGAVGALVLAISKGRLNLALLRQSLDSTTRLSAFVVFILIGARVFSLTFYGVNGHVWVENLLVSLPGGQVGFLIVVNAVVFFLAFFLDFFELAFIIVPLLAGPADKLGIDLIWFGVILAVNMQTSFMHPPFGFALFYLRSVAARVPYADRVTGATIAPVTTGQIYWGAVPFVIIQVIMIGITIAFPIIVTHYQTPYLINPADVKIEIAPGLDQGLPNFGAAPALPPGPSFGPAPPAR